MVRRAGPYRGGDSAARNLFYTTTAAENRSIQTNFDELAGLEGEAKQLNGNLQEIFEGLGYRRGARPR